MDTNGRKEYFGRIIYGSPIECDPPELIETMGGLVTVDGKEIYSVWYADTISGVVKTYDIFHNGAIATTTVKDGHGESFYTAEDFPGRDVFCPPDGVLSETLRGKVRLFGPKNS